MNRHELPFIYGIFLTLTFAMNNNILQWNCRSIKANFEELKLLINEKKPVAVCLQETFLKDSDKFSLKYHSSYLKNCSGNDRSSTKTPILAHPQNLNFSIIASFRAFQIFQRSRFL